MPGHGVIWRKNPLKIVAKYQEWAKAYQENQITIIYDTMWNSTRRMAECIAEGLRETDSTLTVKLFGRDFAAAVSASEAKEDEVPTELGDYNNDEQIGQAAKEHFKGWEKDAREGVKGGFAG